MWSKIGTRLLHWARLNLMILDTKVMVVLLVVRGVQLTCQNRSDPTQPVRLGWFSGLGRLG